MEYIYEETKTIIMAFNYKNLKTGWKRDTKDTRDFVFESTLAGARAIFPDKVDLRAKFPAIYHQGELGSCTANAIGAMFEYCRKKEKKPSFMPSRLFIYYNEREAEGTIKKDDGAEIRTGMKVSKKQGICREELWPYDDGNKQFKLKPSKECYTEALNFQIIQYEKVSQTLSHMKACLAEGFPFAFGIDLYERFYSTATEKTGMVLLPSAHEANEGGHAMCCVGYDDTKKLFIVRNSWGADWGKKGYCFIPYDYLLSTELADSFWMMRLVE